MGETTGRGRTALVVAVAVLIAGLVAIATSSVVPFTLTVRPPIGVESAVRVKLFVTTFNVVLFGTLFWNYVTVYRDLSNKFTLSLVVFAVALLLYALSSNPLVSLLLGFRHGTTLGPFTFIPDVFASLAAVVLVYQSHS